MDRNPNPPRDSRDDRRGAGRPGERDDRAGASQQFARNRPPAPATAPASVTKAGIPHGATESGWLPDVVYTGEKFESGMAFFADALGRITRFSREPADLANARRMPGQAALPGLVNTHSHAFHRVLRGRAEKRGRAEDPRSAWRDAHDRMLGKLTDEDVFDTARMVFLEMLVAGITCVGEFQYLHHQPDGTPWPDANHVSREVMRAAHEVGIRIALLKVAFTRDSSRGDATSTTARLRSATADQFVRETEQLRQTVEKEFSADEAWLGIGAQSLAHLSLDHFKTVSAYARVQRMRLHAHVSTTVAETAACVAEYGRTPVALLAENGIVDKRFTAVDALHLTDDEVKLLGTARASVCACPLTEHNFGLGVAPIEKLIAAGAGIAFGTDSNGQTDLLKDARLLEYHLRVARQSRAIFGPDPATALFHAATVTGARSLGATSGALEVGRPADFFTVNLFDPSIAGAEPDALLANIVFSLERRAIRDVWVGARQRVANGRHPLHGPIVGRFVDAQRRLWSS